MLKNTLFAVVVAVLSVIAIRQHFQIINLETAMANAAAIRTSRDVDIYESEARTRLGTLSNLDSSETNRGKNIVEHAWEASIASCSPEVAVHLNERVEQLIDSKYRALLRKLSQELHEDELRRAKQLLIDDVAGEIISGRRFEDEIPFNPELAELLGEDNYALFQAFQRHGDESVRLLDTFKNRLNERGMDGLEPSQRDELSLLLVRAKSNGLSDIYGDINQELVDEALLRGQEPEAFLQTESALHARQALMVNRVMEQARDILSHDQFRRFVSQSEWDLLGENAIVF